MFLFLIMAQRFRYAAFEGFLVERGMSDNDIKKHRELAEQFLSYHKRRTFASLEKRDVERFITDLVEVKASREHVVVARRAAMEVLAFLESSGGHKIEEIGDKARPVGSNFTPMRDRAARFTGKHGVISSNNAQISGSLSGISRNQSGSSRRLSSQAEVSNISWPMEENENEKDIDNSQTRLGYGSSLGARESSLIKLQEMKVPIAEKNDVQKNTGEELHPFFSGEFSFAEEEVDESISSFLDESSLDQGFKTPKKQQVLKSEGKKRSQPPKVPRSGASPKVPRSGASPKVPRSGANKRVQQSSGTHSGSRKAIEERKNELREEKQKQMIVFLSIGIGIFLLFILVFLFLN